MVDLNINLVAKMAGAGAGGAAGGVAGAAGAGLAGRAGGAMAAGLMGGAGGRTEMIGKGLGQISKQLPGAGMLGDMAGAFKSGGVVGVGMAGVAGIMGFVKQIMESSKVFQGIAGSFFKIFGAMADVFLLPFLPLAMKGMQMLMRYLPNFSRWGQSAADGVENIIKTFKDKGFWGAIGHYIKEAWSFISEDVVGWIKDTLMPALASSVIHIGHAVVNALKGKEQFGAMSVGPDKGKQIVTELGSRDLTDINVWGRGAKRGLKSTINVGGRIPQLWGGKKIYSLDWSPDTYVFQETGKRISSDQEEYLQQMQQQGESPEDMKRMISMGAGPFGQDILKGHSVKDYEAGMAPNRKQLGGRVRSYAAGGLVQGVQGKVCLLYCMVEN